MSEFSFEILSNDEIDMVAGAETPCNGPTSTFQSLCMSDGVDESDGPILCPRIVE